MNRNYLLGSDMLVCPIWEANTTKLEIEFPVVDNWIYWFNSVRKSNKHE